VTPLRDLLEVRGYRQLLAGSFLWHVTRWASLFSVSYLLTGLADSPLLNQAVGALIYAPMVVGGLAAGVISRRFDHRLLVLRLQAVLIPAELAMLALVASGRIEVWMTVPYTLLVGCGSLVNMTAQRAFIYDTVGPAHARPAMTLESAAQAAAVIAGTLGYGALIDALGIRAAFATSVVLLLASRALLAAVPAVRRHRHEGALPSLLEHLAATRALLRRSGALRGLIAVTAAMNFFALGYQPLVPLISRTFSESALTAGVLVAASSIGQVAGGVGLATRHRLHRAQVLILGSSGFLVCLACFALAPTVWLAFAALLLAGVGLSGFGSMQALMSTDLFETEERDIALGAVSTTIGAVEPVGMVQIGLTSELVGPRPALAGSALTGLAALGAIALLWPDLKKSPTPTPTEREQQL
jgi:predicted MFS family arabinose efflux permease